MNKKMRNENMLNCTKNILARVANEAPVDFNESTLDWKRIGIALGIVGLTGVAVATMPVIATSALAGSVGGGLSFIVTSLGAYSAIGAVGIAACGTAIGIPAAIVASVTGLFVAFPVGTLAALLATAAPLSVVAIKAMYGVALGASLYAAFLLLRAGFKKYKGTAMAYLEKTKMELCLLEGGVC